MKKILVTGGHGIIGRHSVNELLAKGMEVHTIGRGTVKPDILPDSIHWHKFDLLKDDIYTLTNNIKADALLHLAWVTEHGKFWHSPENLDWVAASLKLCRAFSESGGKRIVIAGSCAEYDWQHLGDGICNDQTPLNSEFLYGIAKNSFRTIVQSYCHNTNISFAWGRVFLLYGEDEFPARLVPSVIRSLKNNQIAHVSHCQQIRDIMSSQDCGRAFAELVNSPITGTLNIASGEAIKLQTIVEKIREIIGHGTIEYAAMQPNSKEPKILVADTSRLINELGFKAKHNLHSGLTELINNT